MSQAIALESAIDRCRKLSIPEDDEEIEISRSTILQIRGRSESEGKTNDNILQIKYLFSVILQCNERKFVHTVLPMIFLYPFAL